MTLLQPEETFEQKSVRLVAFGVLRNICDALDENNIGGINGRARLDQTVDPDLWTQYRFANGRVTVRQKKTRYGPKPIEILAHFMLADGKTHARFVIENPRATLRANRVGPGIAEFYNISEFPGVSTTKKHGEPPLRSSEQSFFSFTMRQLVAFKARPLLPSPQ